MNKRLTKVFSFSVIVLLALGEGVQLANAVTEETTPSTTTSGEVAPALETADSSEKTVTSSSEAAKEEATSSSAEVTDESTTETSEEKETKKEKAIKPKAANDPVTIPDPVLYQVIRETLNKSWGPNLGIGDGTSITEAQMEMLTTLSRSSTSFERDPIGNLEGIQYATNLKELDLVGKTNDTFSSLPTGFSKLNKLEKLKFSPGALRDIDELENHPTLKVFSAVENNLNSLEGLSGCKELEVVNVSGSQNSGYAQNRDLQNFKGLEKSTKLREIYFNKYDEQRSATKVGNPEPSYVGYGLQSLEGLNCAGSLETLELTGHPGLHTLDGLENYTQLKTLKATGSTNFNGRDTYYEEPGGVSEKYFDPAVHTPTYHQRGLRGSGAIDALSTCTALETVDISRQAIVDLTPLAGKTSIKTLNISYNLIETLQPLVTTNKLVKLLAAHNLLTNLSGLENTSTLEELDVASQCAGARQFKPASSAGINEVVIRGILDDISQLNVTSLVTFYCSDNRLEDLGSLKTASKLIKLIALNNRLSDIKGDLSGCSSLEFANFNNNHFVNFKDIGLEGAKDSLTELYMNEQGLHAWNFATYQNDTTLLVDLDGLKNFTIIKLISMETNKIKDSEMKHIPECIADLRIGYNELQDKAFSTFTQAAYPRLTKIYASNNHISDITPLEKFTTLTKIELPSQLISVPEQGGKVTKKTSPVGFEVDVLKSDCGIGLSFDRHSGWSTTTPTVKPGTNILDVDDPNYDLEGRSPSSNFTYTGNSALSNLNFYGKIFFDADYDIATEAKVELVPTDISGNEITEIAQGGIIYWRAKVKSKDAKYLMKPDFKHHLQYSPHALLDPYVESFDSKASEYVKGARVEVDGTYVATPSGIWSQVDALHNLINDSKVANITVVTKVNDTATPGETANLYFNVQGKNFKLVGDTKKVTIKASIPEELNLSAPERFDFGKKNEASKKAQNYGLDTKSHTATEQTDGFKVRVTDTMQATNRVDWKVVGQLSDLTNSKGNVLKNASASPKLSISDISLAKITIGAGGVETPQTITHGAAGAPTWQQAIDLTAGGSSVTLSEAPKADGAGIWDYQIPFDKVKLNVPSNVNDQAGYTFNGKLTWTLDDTL